jgi:hypothetical protein
VIDLEHPVNPFSTEEIDNIVANLPSGKSPGLDSFNTYFMKKMLETNFFRLLSVMFWFLCLQSINESYIVLIPKVENPPTVNEYMTISLLNSFVKLLTKLLANMLQSKILRVVYQNQYDFIRNRSILDCLA